MQLQQPNRKRCLLGPAPTYMYLVVCWALHAPADLVELCGPTLSATSRFLRSAEQGFLHVPFARTSTVQKRAFAVAGPSVWNGLSLPIRSLPRIFSQAFLSHEGGFIWAWERL